MDIFKLRTASQNFMATYTTIICCWFVLSPNCWSTNTVVIAIQVQISTQQPGESSHLLYMIVRAHTYVSGYTHITPLQHTLFDYGGCAAVPRAVSP